MQVDKLEQLKERMIQVRGIFRDTEATEFVIVTIPTVSMTRVLSVKLTSAVLLSLWLHLSRS